MSGRFISYIRYISIQEGIKGGFSNWKKYGNLVPPRRIWNTSYLFFMLFGIKEQKIFISLPNWTTLIFLFYQLNTSSLKVIIL